ncbi:MAG: hypothetical protein HN348_18190 [Proteobacteria bacterium]|nr:hypothetical protein [Pseudomonadota bacterium]
MLTLFPRLVFVALLLTSCGGRKRIPPVSAVEQAEAREALGEFVEYWLAPANIAPPTIEFSEKTVQSGRVSGTAKPLRPEDAPWNQWSDETSRLFNNRIGYFFEIRLDIDGTEEIRWLPNQTWLEINEPGGALRPATKADELLGPLQNAALHEIGLVLEGDLVDRTRAAGPFRASYLPSSGEGSLSGTVGFPHKNPSTDADRHVVGVQLMVEVEVGDEAFDLVWVFD